MKHVAASTAARFNFSVADGCFNVWSPLSPIFETLIVARELYVKNNFIYDFFYDFNMSKFMIWIFSIFFFMKNI